MRSNKFVVFTTVLLLGALALAVTAAAADQHSGTWKMNPDKSKYSPGPAPQNTTVKVKRIGADTIESTMKKGGQVMMTVTSKVSKDGKTRTSTFKGKDAEGHDVLNVVVSDKQ